MLFFTILLSSCRCDSKSDIVCDNRYKLRYHISPEYMDILTLKAPIMSAADNTHAEQRIDMKNQALFSSKDKSKKLKRRLLQFFIGPLRVKFFAC